MVGSIVDYFSDLSSVMAHTQPPPHFFPLLVAPLCCWGGHRIFGFLLAEDVAGATFKVKLIEIHDNCRFALRCDKISPRYIYPGPKCLADGHDGSGRDTLRLQVATAFET